MQWQLKKNSTKSGTKSLKAKQGARRPKPARGKVKKAGKAGKLSRLAKPESMSLEEWQVALRRQFGREQTFALKNLGDEPVFSEFEVANPQTQRSYRVRIRGSEPGDNYCSCPDFATNTLGTCKHIEFVLARLERKRGVPSALKAGHQPEYSEVYLHYGAQREVRFRPGADCPPALARLAARYFGPEGNLLPDAFAHFDTFLTEAGRIDHELNCQDDVLAFIAEVRDAERRRQVVAEAFPRGVKSPAFKDLLKIPLYDYQREGALFAAAAGRALIGDEMGLGKTIQAVAATEIMARHFGVERVLIVCPTSLKHQWQREIARFVERSAEVIGGLRGARKRGFASNTFFKITNYDTVHADVDLIAGWSPDLVILDEAQRIKNWNTRTARSVKRIASPYAIVLTGTPLENRLEELISIVQFVDRFRLGPTFRLLHEHQIRDEHGKVVGYQHLDRIGQTLAPLLVRRQKDQVLDQLPERIDTNVFVPMTPLQMTHHSENQEIVARIVHKWRTHRFLSEADQRRLMIALQRMRMSCDSTYLVDHQNDHGVKADEAVTLLEEILERPQGKVVVFSQWLRMHELLVRRLKRRGWGHVLFHGGVPGSKRKDLIDRFRDDPKCRIFLSTDAGGVGLNLQHASVVLNMDLPWNPAVLEQRIGRVHRLGQREPVRVVNFVAKGTIEEGMLSVLKFKKSLFGGVLDGGDKEVFMGGSRLNKFMEQVEAASESVSETMLEDAEDALRALPDGAETAPTSGRRSGPSKGSRMPDPQTAGLAAMSEPEEEIPGHAASATDAWSGLLQAGLSLVQQLASTMPNGTKIAGPAATGPKIGGRSLIQRDERTGEPYLKLPVPSPVVLEQALKGIAALLEGFKK